VTPLGFSFAFALLLAPPSPPSAAPAGPPLICHPFEIGDARSLPWDAKDGARPDYDKKRLAADVAEILKTEENLIVRMETLRRAACYVGRDRALAWELLGRSGLMVLEQDVVGSKESSAWFDTGFLAACFDQLGVDLGFRAGVAEGTEGYAYLLRALESARREGSDHIATIEFATSLALLPLAYRGTPTAQDRERYERHLEAARHGAGPGSLLERNLISHTERFGEHAAKKSSG